MLRKSYVFFTKMIMRVMPTRNFKKHSVSVDKRFLVEIVEVEVTIVLACMPPKNKNGVAAK